MANSSSPWNKIQPVTNVASLQEIMSEEIARDIQNKEEQKLAEFLAEQKMTNTNSEITEETLQNLDDKYCDSDAVIAKMLQYQYDREYDSMLKKTEDKFNGTSKVSVSFSNYRRNPNSEYEEDSDEEGPENPEEKKDWDRFETVEKEFNAIPRCGYQVRQGNMITKHDTLISGRRNACRVMGFPPEFQTGDGAGFDMRLSNKVFNSLKAYSRAEQARRHRLHDRKEDHATAVMGVDEKTRLILYKLINNQFLQQVNGVISTGKESVVIHGDCDPEYPVEDVTLPKECAIKIFKTTLNEFKTRDKYIKDDHRFKDKYSKQNPRKTIHLWAEKEMNNLKRIKKIGLPCPDVLFLRKHVLVMSFIGENNRSAPKLKDAVLKFEDLCDAYEQCTEAITKMYQEAQLVHADFSEYNVLWHADKCWYIDVSQAVEHAHPSAFEFLLRDCGNISSFFTRKGVPDVKTAEELFVEVTGMDSATAIESQRKVKKEKPHLVNNMNHVCNSGHNFENAWDESKKITANDIVTTANIQNDLQLCNLVEPPQA